MKHVLLALAFISINVAQAQCLEGTDFENGGSDPAGWIRTNSYIGTTDPYEGTYFAGFNTTGDMLTLPALNCPGEICYYWRSSGFNADFDLLVEWSDDGGTSWNTAQTYSFDGSGGASTTYAKQCVNLPEGSYTDPSNVIIRFNQTRRVASSFYLDSVCVKTGVCSITPTELRFTTTPVACTNANTNFNVVVCATDGSGNIDNTYGGNITVSKNTGTGTLGGTTTQAATSGCATFSDLQLDQQDDYTLTASDGVLTNATSSTIRIESTCPTVDTLTVVTYNLLNFPNSLVGCANYVSNREDTLKKIMKYINPDVLMVCELQDATGADLILNSVLNTDGVTKYAKANFVINTSSGDNTHNNMFYYNSDKITLYSQSEIQTDLRDASEYIIYGNDPNLASHNDTTFIDFYETHLKAGSATADSLRRVEEADSIMKYIDVKSSTRNNIIGGDFNFYTDQEEAYQILISGPNAFNDPVNREGSWNNNGAFADVHSQSTRAGVDYDCGSFGGTDDRFDFLLVSSNILSGANRVTFVPGSYSSLGNDGSVFNQDISDPSNTSGVPDSILSALYYMSDHLPVVMKVEVEFPNTTLGFDSNDVDTHEDHVSENKTVQIYPNPARETITIAFEKANYNTNCDVVLSDIRGAVLATYTLESDQVEQSIDISNIAPGMYVLQLFNGISMISTKKLVVE